MLTIFLFIVALEDIPAFSEVFELVGPLEPVTFTPTTTTIAAVKSHEIEIRNFESLEAFVIYEYENMMISDVRYFTDSQHYPTLTSQSSVEVNLGSKSRKIVST